MANITDLENGKYRVIISNGYRPDGTRNRLVKTIVAKSLTECKKKVKILEAEFLKANKSIDGDSTFIEVVEIWRKRHEKNLGDKTVERYEQILRNSLIPCFGTKKLKKITKEMVNRYIDSLGEDGVRRDGKRGGYSERTIQHYFRLLSSILQFAVKNDYIEVNECRKMDTPKVKKNKYKEYSIKQVDAIQQHLESEPLKYKVFIMMSLATGARKGEVLGIEWKDINFETREIKLCRTSMAIKGKGVITKNELKNGETGRKLVLPSEVIEVLKEYKVYQDEYKEARKDKWIETDRLFIQHDGKAMHPSTPGLWFNKFQVANGLERITLHEIRHIAISTLLRSGMDIVKVSKWAGHKDPEVTLRVYAHVLDERKEEEAQIIADTFFRKSAV